MNNWDFLGFLGAVFCVIIAVIIGVTKYNLTTAEYIHAAIKAGASPLQARCAFSSSEDKLCYTLKNP